MTQLDNQIISALRTVLEDVCGHLPLSSTTARTFVASKILECARDGQQTYEDLKEAGQMALKSAPTMWR
jgi:urease gamma subunit